MNKNDYQAYDMIDSKRKWTLPMRKNEIMTINEDI